MPRSLNVLQCMHFGLDRCSFERRGEEIQRLRFSLGTSTGGTKMNSADKDDLYDEVSSHRSAAITALRIEAHLSVA